jgi:hypothetical protein
VIDEMQYLYPLKIYYVCDGFIPTA